MSFEQVKIGEVYQTERSGSSISQLAVKKISRYLVSQNIYLIIDSVEWVWKVEQKTGNETHTGTLPKRIAKVLHDTHKIKLTEEQKARIGVLAKEGIITTETQYFDFTDTFDWTDGDFGDEGSCFWSDRENAREIMENAGIFAVRFYADEEYEHGTGRAWIKETSKFLVVFNGYSDTFASSTQAISHILANFLGMSCKKINLCNNNCCGGLIYINGGTGYIVGNEDDIEDIYSYDLDIECPELCYACDQYEWDCTNVDDTMVCPDCFDRYYTICDGCGEPVNQEDAVSVHCESFCSSCFDENYFFCSECGDTACNTEGGEFNGSPYCEYCFEKLFCTCKACGETVKQEECAEIDEENYCLGCVSECEQCSDQFVIDGSESADNDVCPACFLEMKKEQEEKAEEQAA